jgi:branched-chain amino acid transport system permease protein
MANVLIGNFFIAVTGSYYVAYSLVAVPDAFSFHKSVFTMMYAVVGGLTHSLIGPIVGSIVVTLIPEYLRVAKEYEPIITSAAIILIIVFMPMGILGLINQRMKHWLIRKS